jgi:hypothetical protein
MKNLSRWRRQIKKRRKRRLMNINSVNQCWRKLFAFCACRYIQAKWLVRVTRYWCVNVLTNLVKQCLSRRHFVALSVLTPRLSVYPEHNNKCTHKRYHDDNSAHISSLLWGYDNIHTWQQKGLLQCKHLQPSMKKWILWTNNKTNFFRKVKNRPCQRADIVKMC